MVSDIKDKIKESHQNSEAFGISLQSLCKVEAVLDYKHAM